MSNIVVGTFERYGIVHKVLTNIMFVCLYYLIKFFSDNASNNDTCMKAVTEKIDPEELRWDPIQRRVQCTHLYVHSTLS